MKVTATARFLRIAPRKVRLVIDTIRGKHVTEALRILKFVDKRAALPVEKLVRSAIANAENNFKLDKKNLMVTSITANEGPALKRFKPRAFGRAGMIRKRSSHISVVLEDKK